VQIGLAFEVRDEIFERNYIKRNRFFKYLVNLSNIAKGHVFRDPGFDLLKAARRFYNKKLREVPKKLIQKHQIVCGEASSLKSLRKSNNIGL